MIIKATKKEVEDAKELFLIALKKQKISEKVKKIIIDNFEIYCSNLGV